VIGFLGAVPWSLSGQLSVRVSDLAAEAERDRGCEDEDEELHGKSALSKHALLKSLQARLSRSRPLRRLVNVPSDLLSRLLAAGYQQARRTRLSSDNAAVLRLHVPRRQPLPGDDPDSRQRVLLFAAA
jgi:hypothetical protein